MPPHVIRLIAGAQTLDGIARAAVELGVQLTHLWGRAGGRGRDHPRIVAVAGAAIAGLRASSWRQIRRRARHTAGIPVTTAAPKTYSPGVPERRRSDRAGTAYPLLDDRSFGAFILLARRWTPIHPWSRTSAAADDLGPRIAAARAVHDAERRAVVDPLTGLRNRREFEHALSTWGRRAADPETGTLIYVDLDHFKK